MCELNRADFMKAGRNFDKHITQEHDPWRYVFFIYYMKEKGEDELNGVEQLCWDNYQKLKTEWVPIGNTLYLCNFFWDL